jgi:hypothetical protein
MTTWDALPSEAEIKEIKQLLARIQELKNVAEKELTGHSSWCSFFRDEFNRYKLEFPNCGHTLA